MALTETIRKHEEKIIDQLARDLHEAGREAVEKGNVLNRKPCTFRNENIVNVHGEVFDLVCVEGNIFIKKAKTSELIPTDDKCGRCKGSGFEPFLDWDEISEDARNGRISMARYIFNLYPNMTRKRSK